MTARPVREDHAVPVDDQDAVPRLGERVVDPQLPAVAPEVGRNDPRLHGVDADWVRQVDRAACPLELDERQIDAVGHALSVRVASVPPHAHVPAREQATSHRYFACADADRDREAICAPKREVDVRGGGVAAADRREDLVDAGLGDGARFELEALRHREGGRRRDEQQQSQDRRGVPLHRCAIVRRAYR